MNYCKNTGIIPLTNCSAPWKWLQYGNTQRTWICHSFTNGRSLYFWVYVALVCAIMCWPTFQAPALARGYREDRVHVARCERENSRLPICPNSVRQMSCLVLQNWSIKVQAEQRPAVCSVRGGESNVTPFFKGVGIHKCFRWLVTWLLRYALKCLVLGVFSFASLLLLLLLIPLRRSRAVAIAIITANIVDL